MRNANELTLPEQVAVYARNGLIKLAASIIAENPHLTYRELDEDAVNELNVRLALRGYVLIEEVPGEGAYLALTFREYAETTREGSAV